MGRFKHGASWYQIGINLACSETPSGTAQSLLFNYCLNHCPMPKSMHVTNCWKARPLGRPGGGAVMYTGGFQKGTHKALHQIYFNLFPVFLASRF